MTRTLLLAAALLMPGVALAADPPPAPVQEQPAIALRESVASIGAPPPKPPAGPEVPVEIKCYRRDTVPFVLTDKDGNTLFEIRCPK
jgi:hypothetical protein